MQSFKIFMSVFLIGVFVAFSANTNAAVLINDQQFDNPPFPGGGGVPNATVNVTDLTDGNEWDGIQGNAWAVANYTHAGGGATFWDLGNFNGTKYLDVYMPNREWFDMAGGGDTLNYYWRSTGSAGNGSQLVVSYFVGGVETQVSTHTLSGTGQNPLVSIPITATNIEKIRFAHFGNNGVGIDGVTLNGTLNGTFPSGPTLITDQQFDNPPFPGGGGVPNATVNVTDLTDGNEWDGIQGNAWAVGAYTHAGGGATFWDLGNFNGTKYLDVYMPGREWFDMGLGDNLSYYWRSTGGAGNGSVLSVSYFVGGVETEVSSHTLSGTGQNPQVIVNITDTNIEKIRFQHVGNNGVGIDGINLTGTLNGTFANLPPSITISQPEVTLNNAPDTFTGVVATVSDSDNATNTLSVNVTSGESSDLTVNIDSVDATTGEVTVTVTASGAVPRGRFPITIEVDDGQFQDTGNLDILMDIPHVIQDSTGWAFGYEANGIVPSAEPGQTWSTGLDASIVTGPTFATIDRSAASGGGDMRDSGGGGNWQSNVAGGTSWTVEMRIRVIDDFDAVNGGFGAWIETTAAQNDTALFSVGDDNIKWDQASGTQLILDNNDNSVGFHEVRVFYDNVTRTFNVYRNGVEIGNGLPNTTTVNGLDWALFGDIGGAWRFIAELDYLRWTPGAFLPNPPANFPPTIVTTDDPTLALAAGTTQHSVATVSDAESATNTLIVTVAAGNTPNLTVAINNVDAVTGEVTVDVTQSATLAQGPYTVTLQVDDGTSTATTDVDFLFVGNVLLAGNPDPDYPFFWHWSDAGNSASINGPGAEALGIEVDSWIDLTNGDTHDIPREFGAGNGGTWFPGTS